MRLRLFILTLLPLMVLSCSINIGEEKSFDEVLPSSEEVMLSSKTRAAEDDFQVHLDDAMLYAKMIEPKKEVESIVPFVQEGDTLMFYVYYNDGWKLISGDKRIQPELINEPTGKRTPEELCDGEQITVQEYVEFLSALKEYPYADKDTQYVEFWNKITRKQPKKEEPKTRTVWEPNLESYPWLFHKIVCEDEHPSYATVTYFENSGNLTNTQWGQGNDNHPYWNSKIPCNYYGDRPPLGCVAVAISQLLYYLYHEKNLDLGLFENVLMNGYYLGNHFIPNLSKSQYNQSSTRWNSMALTYSGNTLGVSYAQDLMLVVGEGVNMDYTIEGSGSNITYAHNYLTQILVASADSSYSPTIIINSVHNGYPIYIEAGDNTYGKHAWLIDGYAKKETKLYEYYRWEKVYPSDPDFTPVYGDDYLTPDEVSSLSYSIYDGLEGYFLIEHEYPEYVLMNWGYDGIGRGTEYFDASTSAYWHVDDYYFGANKMILHNFVFPTR